MLGHRLAVRLQLGVLVKVKNETQIHPVSHSLTALGQMIKPAYQNYDTQTTFTFR